MYCTSKYLSYLILCLHESWVGEVKETGERERERGNAIVEL